MEPQLNSVKRDQDKHMMLGKLIMKYLITVFTFTVIFIVAAAPKLMLIRFLSGQPDPVIHWTKLHLKLLMIPHYGKVSYPRLLCYAV